MRYLGGKHRLAKLLAEEILPHSEGKRIIEPFCGGLSATVALQPQFASDISNPLIKMVAAAQNGWEPDVAVDEARYKESLAKPDSECDPQDAFNLICCSWGGKWKGGFARQRRPQNRDFAQQGRNALMRKIQATRDVQFRWCSYQDWAPKLGDVVYCDPPYDKTSQGYVSSSFSSENFWDWVKQAAERGALLFVSEFSAPEWVEIHAEFNSRVNLRKTEPEKQNSVERLYRIGELA